MSVFYRATRARAPYKIGVIKVSKPAAGKDAGASKPETAVTPEAVEPQPEAEVNAEAEVETEAEPAAEAEPVVEIEGTNLADAGFSATSVKNLNANNVYTVEQLLAVLEVTPDLADLPKIGTKSCATIMEELSIWKGIQETVQ